jgi:hypothetical protein
LRNIFIRQQDEELTEAPAAIHVQADGLLKSTGGFQAGAYL